MHLQKLKLIWYFAYKEILLTRMSSLLVSAIIACGVITSAVTIKLYQTMSSVPLQDANELYVPLVDMWGPGGWDGGAPPPALDYFDAISLVNERRARGQSAVYQIDAAVRSIGKPYDRHALGYAVSHDFFKMFNVPFAHGSDWHVDGGIMQDYEVVISHRLAMALFHTDNSVGKDIAVNGRSYQIVGVMKDWHPVPRVFDVINDGGFEARPVDFFIPLASAVAQGIKNSGFRYCNSKLLKKSFENIEHSTCIWIGYFVKLDGPQEYNSYLAYLTSYASEQQLAGRFTWRPNVRLLSIRDWLKYMHVVPNSASVSALVSVCFLLICVVNSSGILMSNFMRRERAFILHRALGASSSDLRAIIFTYAFIVGVFGALWGWLGLESILFVLRRELPFALSDKMHLDLELLLVVFSTSVLSLVASAVAPAIRCSRLA